MLADLSAVLGAAVADRRVVPWTVEQVAAVSAADLMPTSEDRARSAMNDALGPRVARELPDGAQEAR